MLHRGGYWDGIFPLGLPGGGCMVVYKKPGTENWTVGWNESLASFDCSFICRFG